MDTKESVYDNPPPTPADGTNGGESTDPNGATVPTNSNTTEKQQSENIQGAKDGSKKDNKNNPNDKNKKPDVGSSDTVAQLLGFKSYEEFKKAKKKKDDEYTAEVGKYIYGQNLTDGQVKSMLGTFTPETASKIYGMPYQWMPEVDRRVDGTGQFGRKFYEKILTKMPILVLTPGLPDFM